MGEAGGTASRFACCIALLVPFSLAAFLGWWLQKECISELGAMLAAEVLLIMCWSCARRPLIGFTYLYMLGCFVLLVRETQLTISGRLPCGLSTFGLSCVERTCVEYNRIPIIGIRTSCARRECIREVEVEQSHVYFSQDSFTKWSGTALVTVWIAFAISARQLLRWRFRARIQFPCNTWPADNAGREMEYISVILMVPVTYGVCALHALRVLSVNHEDTWQAEGMMSAAELYSALSLFAFQRLLQIYVKSCGTNLWSEGEAAAVDTEVATHDCPECDIKADMLKQQANLRNHFQELVAAGLKQYVVLVFGCNALEMVAKTWNWLYPSYCRTTLSLVAAMWFPHHEISLTLNATMMHHNRHFRSSSLACEDLWNTVSLLMVVANFFTCSIALFAVLKYEQTFSKLLKPMSPFWKFWGVKGLLSVNFLQRLVLMAAGFVGKDAKLSKEFRTFLNFYLICVEVMALAFLNGFAYTCSMQGGSEAESLGLTSDPDPGEPELELELAEIVGKNRED